MGKITKSNIQAILRNTGLDPAQAKEAAANIIKALAAALAAGEAVELRGLGTLEPRELKARVMRNPRTLVPVNVPARTVIFFKPSRKLKRAINGKGDQGLR
jgi:nucleoid DNA-binding protein